MGGAGRGGLRPRGRVPTLRRATPARLSQGASPGPRTETEGAARHRPRRRHRVLQVLRFTRRARGAPRRRPRGPHGRALPAGWAGVAWHTRGPGTFRRAHLEATRPRSSGHDGRTRRGACRAEEAARVRQPAAHRGGTRWDRKDPADPRGCAPGGDRLRAGPDLLRPARGDRRPGGRPAGRGVLDRAGPRRRGAGAGRPGRCVRRPALRAGPRQLRAGAPGGDRRGRAPHPLPRPDRAGDQPGRSARTRRIPLPAGPAVLDRRGGDRGVSGRTAVRRASEGCAPGLLPRRSR